MSQNYVVVVPAVSSHANLQPHWTFMRPNYSIVDPPPFEKDVYQECAIHIGCRCCKRPKIGSSPIRPQCCGCWTEDFHQVLISLRSPRGSAAIAEEVLDEWIARVMVHYRWHYDENALHVLSKGSGRKLQLIDLQILKFIVGFLGPAERPVQALLSNEQRRTNILKC